MARDAAIALFSGEKTGEQAREIWLVDKAPVVIQKLDAAVTALADFMQSQGLACTPEAVHSLKGDDARAAFIKNFKEVQRLKTQLDQYTDLTEDNAVAIEHILPAEDLQGFRGAYLETAQRLKQQQAQQDKGGDANGGDTADVDQLDFEFVLVEPLQPVVQLNFSRLAATEYGHAGVLVIRVGRRPHLAVVVDALVLVVVPVVIGVLAVGKNADAFTADTALALQLQLETVLRGPQDHPLQLLVVGHHSPQLRMARVVALAWAYTF